MEKFSDDNLPNSELVNTEQKYNYPEVIERMKPALISLVRQIKDKIESGQYTTLISDEAKGRIPTLILRKIFLSKSPRDFNTIFLAFGRAKFRLDDDLDNYIERNKNKWGKSLVISEQIFSTFTLKSILEHFDTKAGYSNYDIASVFSSRSKDNIVSKMNRCDDKRLSYKHNIFLGEELVHPVPDFIENNLLQEMGGVERRVIDSPGIDYSWVQEDEYPKYVIGAHPERIDKLKTNPEPNMYNLKKTFTYKQKEVVYDNIGTSADLDFIRELRASVDNQKEVPEEERLKTQSMINKARKDVYKLADEIIKEVWGND